jgi:hypothetical protein
MNTTSLDKHTHRPGALRFWTASRAFLRTRLEADAARRQLRRELACYNTPSEIDDLLAAVRHGANAGSSRK